VQDQARRKFLSAGGAAAAGVLAGCSAPQDQQATAASGKTYKWKMVTTWPPNMPVMQEGAELLAKWVGEMSGDRLQIKVYPAGAMVPALQVFETVSGGVAEMGHGAAYYWAGKVKAAQFFTAVPFGLNAQGMNAWLYDGGGLELWREIYAKYNLVPFPAGNTGVQMGGWFNKEINATSDLEGLKMRIPGLGGAVIKAAGGAPQNTAGGEIYTNLERGVIDATEWIGPYHDAIQEFHRVAKFYYYPGWHEPGPVLECTVNKAAWESLPPDLQAIVEAAAARVNAWMLAAFEARNNAALENLVAEHKVVVKKFPDAVLAEFKRLTDKVIAEQIAEDPDSQRVYEAFDKFRKGLGAWGQYSERAYHDLPGVGKDG
jgi:TRAP-type mannitol/chloroaromatic compound transport system substrate-binding protein